jgi:ABC-type Fe3+-hydroxamate transport system substrate-binding protein
MNSKFLLKTARGIFIDNLVRSVYVPNTPKRIVCLVPSITELLYSLQLEERVIGITKFCVHPVAWKKEKTIIGGTKNIQIEKIRQLQPDLIIASKEENIKEQVDALQTIAPVYTTDVVDFDSALAMIKQIGAITRTTKQAKAIEKRIVRNWEHLTPLTKRNNTLYLIWNKPYMTVGNDTYIHSILRKAGFSNILNDKTRYPELDEVGIKNLNPNIVLLSSEPYPFKATHIAEIKSILPKAVVKLVDGEYFSWYGARMLHAPEHIQELINEVHANLR